MPDLAQAIWSALQSKSWFQGGPTVLAQNPGEVNIVYVEGMNLDGTPNANTFNRWMDARLALQWSNGVPFIAGRWLATTEPGAFYTSAPLNVGGAAHVSLGQYRAWRVGAHRAGTPGEQEALVQAASITITRDRNKDGNRSGDPVEISSNAGINQHHGWNMELVGKASAGCLVGQSVDGHREFMRLVKSDPRYLQNKGFIFHTAIIPCVDVQKFLV